MTNIKRLIGGGGGEKEEMKEGEKNMECWEWINTNKKSCPMQKKRFYEWVDFEKNQDFFYLLFNK